MNREKKIVIINQDSGYLMIDIANEYYTAGYDVSLITGRLLQRSIALNENIKCSKIIQYNNSNQFKRLFTWIFGTFQILLTVLLRFKSHELLFVSNPPFAPILGILLKNKISVLIFDVYPDVLVESKYIAKNSFFTRIWEKLNTKIYSKAEFIYTISLGMKELVCKYVKVEKIVEVNLWSDNDSLKPIPKDENPFIEKLNLQSKFIVLYSGNLSSTSDVEIIPELAACCKNSNIHFLIIGNGQKFNLIKKYIDDYGLTNCTILPRQDYKVLNYSLSSSSLSIVSLGQHSSNVSMPSKLFSYLAVGSPILSIASHYCDLAKLVDREGVGKNFEPNKKNDILQFILEIYSNKEYFLLLSKNAISSSKKFTKENAKLFIRN